MSRPDEEHSVSFAEIESAMYTRRRLITKWIRLFATRAANIKIEKTDRQTMYRDYRSENREKNSYKRDIAILANSQKTILRKARVLSPDVRLYKLAVLT